MNAVFSRRGKINVSELRTQHLPRPRPRLVGFADEVECKDVLMLILDNKDY